MMNVNHNMKIKNQVGRTEELTTVLLITIINMRSPPVLLIAIMSHSQMLGKVEYGRGPIFKVVLEC